jgi:chromate reductase
MLRVLGISGSLRRDSYNTRLLRVAARLLPRDAELEIYDGLKTIPPYDADDDTEPAPAAVAELKTAIAEAGALLVATPEYNGSIPGVLKNALDWASRPATDNVLRGKPTAIVGATTGMFGAVWAQAETRKVLATIGALVVDRELPVARADDAFDSNDQLADRQLENELSAILSELVSEAPASTGRQAFGLCRARLPPRSHRAPEPRHRREPRSRASPTEAVQSESRGLSE